MRGSTLQNGAAAEAFQNVTTIPQQLGTEFAQKLPLLNRANGFVYFDRLCCDTLNVQSTQLTVLKNKQRAGFDGYPLIHTLVLGISAVASHHTAVH